MKVTIIGLGTEDRIGADWPDHLGVSGSSPRRPLAAFGISGWGRAIPVVDALSMLRSFDTGLRAVAVVPPLGDQRRSRTDIHALGLKDRLPIVRDIVEGLRRLLN